MTDKRIRFWVDLPKEILDKLDKLASKDRRSRARFASLLLEETVKGKRL